MRSAALSWDHATGGGGYRDHPGPRSTGRRHIAHTLDPGECEPRSVARDDRMRNIPVLRLRPVHYPLAAADADDELLEVRIRWAPAPSSPRPPRHPSLCHRALSPLTDDQGRRA